MVNHASLNSSEEQNQDLAIELTVAFDHEIPRGVLLYSPALELTVNAHWQKILSCGTTAFRF